MAERLKMNRLTSLRTYTEKNVVEEVAIQHLERSVLALAEATWLRRLAMEDN